MMHGGIAHHYRIHLGNLLAQHLVHALRDRSRGRTARAGDETLADLAALGLCEIAAPRLRDRETRFTSHGC